MSRYYDEENDRMYVKCATCGEQTESGCACGCDEKETNDETEEEMEDYGKLKKQYDDILNKTVHREIVVTEALRLACERIADEPQTYEEANTADVWMARYLKEAEGKKMTRVIYTKNPTKYLTNAGFHKRSDGIWVRGGEVLNSWCKPVKTPDGKDWQIEINLSEPPPNKGISDTAGT